MAARHNWGMYFPSFGAWEAAYGGYYAIVEATKPPPFPGFKRRAISTPFGEVKIAKNTHPFDTTKWVKIEEGKFFASHGVRKSHIETKTITETHIAKLGDTMWDDDDEYTTSSLVDVTVDDGEVVYSDLWSWVDLDHEFLVLEQEIDVLMVHHNRYRYGMPFVHLPEFETLRLAAIEEACDSSSADAYSILKLVATQDEWDSWQEAPASTPVKPATVKGKVTTVADCDRPENPFAALKGKFK